MKTIKILILILSFLLLISAKEKTEVSINLIYQFPVISIKNLSGKTISIKAVSENEGSIGFRTDIAVYWLKGKPKATAKENKAVYSWQIENEMTVTLLIYKSDNDYNFQLQLTKKGIRIQPDEWYINIAAEKDEYFTGIFERVVDGNQALSWKEGIKEGLNLRGQIIDMKLKPTVSAYAPFYISSGNYGLFFRGTWPGRYDFCKTDSAFIKIMFEGPELSFKVYRAAGPAEIICRHALETGPSFVPPRWAFGQWRWRDEIKNTGFYYDSTHAKSPFNTQLVEDILMAEAFDVPLSAYWIDRPYCPGPHGFDDYEIDTSRLPYFEPMIRWLNHKNIELMMWIGPFVMGNMAEYAKEKGYELKSKPIKNPHVLIDFTHEEACRWWGENGPGKLARMGVKGFKLDRADGETEMDSLTLFTSIGTTYRENFNDYPRQYVKATYDAVKPVLGNNFILFPRAQYTGSSAYGGMWAGDTRGFPEGLRSAVIAMQRCAVMGYPVWGSDIGGYGRDFNRETCMRWLGFGCFSPIMETGPTVNRGFWNLPDTPHYDVELIAAWRLYSKTRLQIIDYTHKLAIEANQTGMPIARPLFMIYPKQPEAWKDWTTYLYGPDILVSIVWEKGKTKHTLYLPAGEEWIDAWEKNKIYKGGSYIEVDAPMYKTPVFIRKGSGIDLGNLQQIFEESIEIAKQRPDLQKMEMKEGWGNFK